MWSSPKEKSDYLLSYCPFWILVRFFIAILERLSGAICEGE